MKVTITFLALLSVGVGQAAQSPKTPSEGLGIELRTSSARVRISDEIDVTVFFRSPEKEITIWNALEWGAPYGLYLKVVDASGHEVQNDFAPFLHPIPPNATGKEALISIGGTVFAGFDSRIAVKPLFLKPGRYTIRCIYMPPLSRDYFRGHKIWGKEDGPLDSPSVPVLVE